MKLLLSTLFVYTLLICNVMSHSAEDWKSRSVYQIITDRFARTDGDTRTCTDLTKYCGGTFKGIQNNLDYIQGMGFDAIWISPVVENTKDGYHGYWIQNLYTINPEFGTEEELHELIKACHDRGIWVMVDVVANHIGYVDNENYTTIIPFNDKKFFNNYTACESVDPKDQDGIETCWLSGLPDLNQNDPFVKNALLDWVKEFVAKWQFDALRIDTVPHVSKKFWAEFSKQAGIYTIGEVLNMDIEYLAGYQGPVDGVLNYAIYTALRNSFQSGGSMNGIEEYYERAKRTWADQSLLGNFINNHDNDRFLSATENVQAFKAAVAFTLGCEGIPMVYYGDEQAFKGGRDPANREPLFADMKTDSDIYNFLKQINNFRKQSHYYTMEQTQRYVDDSFYAFTRGPVMFAFTNSLEPQTRSITNHPYPDGTLLCNIFHAEDCVKVQNGAFPAVLNNGEVKIFTPAKTTESRATRQRANNNIAMGMAFVETASA